MGMYSEVFHPCPGCGQVCCEQIPQLSGVLGFGFFHVNNPEQLAASLSTSQLRELRKKVAGLAFRCTSCSQTFVPFPDGESEEERQHLARELFGT